MKDALKSLAALFFGFSFLVTGHGILGSLVGVRLTLEGIGPDIAGLVMSGFFIGIVSGGLLTPGLIQRVGHIRVFGAMAALAAVSAAVHPLWVAPVPWFALRLLTGFATTSMYIVVESWVNDRATNDNRGRLLSFYMLVWYLSVGGSQFLLTAGDPAGSDLFIYATVLYALGAVPVLLATGKAPTFHAPQRVSLRALWRLAPLGMGACFLTGSLHGTLMSMAPVYAKSSGLGDERVAMILSAIFIGAAVLQWPIGRMSDRVDRRWVLALASLAGAALSLVAWQFEDVSFVLLALLMGLFGGLCLPLYSLCLALCNDRLQQDQMVGAAATMYLLVGVGAMTGPPLAGVVMDHIGPEGFFLFEAGLMALLGGIALLTLLRPQRGIATQ